MHESGFGFLAAGFGKNPVLLRALVDKSTSKGESFGAEGAELRFIEKSEASRSPQPV
jgi:hypothetical protein